MLLGIVHKYNHKYPESEAILKEGLALQPAGDYDPKLLYVLGPPLRGLGEVRRGARRPEADPEDVRRRARWRARRARPWWRWTARPTSRAARRPPRWRREPTPPPGGPPPPARPGSSKRWVAPGTISSRFSQRSRARASSVHVDHRLVAPAHDEERGGLDPRQGRPRQVGTPPARHHGAHLGRPVSAAATSAAPPAGAGAEVADGQAAGARDRPAASRWRRRSRSGQQADVEAQVAGPRVDGLLLRRSAGP